MAFGRAADLPLLVAAGTAQALLLVAADSAGTAGIADRLLLLLVAAGTAGTAGIADRLLLVVAAGIADWLLLVVAADTAGTADWLLTGCWWLLVSNGHL